MSEAVHTIQYSHRWAYLQKRVLNVVLTAALLSGLYWIYSLTVSPRIQPPKPKARSASAQAPQVPKPKKNQDVAELYLQSVPWASTARIQYRNEDDTAFVFTNERKKHRSEKAIRFKPFAMVWMQKGKKENDVPYVIISETAYVKFANPIDNFTKSKPGRIVGGTLEGKVTILGPDGLKVEGREFWFSETSMSIWSDDDVAFWQGPHQGTAKGLDVELIEDPVARAKEKLAVAGIKKFSLRQNVKMDLLFEGDGDPGLEVAQGTDGSRPEEHEKKEPVTIHIESKGSFSYALESLVATFVKDVQVFRPTGPGMYDSLMCDRKLTLNFEPKTPPPSTPLEDVPAPLPAPELSETEPDTDKDDRFKNIQSDLTIRRLHAEGEAVFLNSQSNTMIARMKDFIYDVKTKVAVLTDKDTVQVKQGSRGENEIHSPNITLVHDREGTVSSITCKGAGWLSSKDPDSGLRKLIAQWNKQMRKYPDRESTMDIVELEQNAVIMQPEQKATLAGDFIRFWVKDNENQSDAQHKTSPHNKKSDQFRLDRMIAINNVTMSNPDMHAVTKRLEARFEPDTTTPSSASLNQEQHSRSRTTMSRKTVSSSGHSLTSSPQTHPLTAVPHSQTMTPKPTDPPPAERTAEPMHVTADFIGVRIIQGTEQSQSRVAEVWPTGNVYVKQVREPGESQLEVRGDRMHVVNRSENDQLMHVFGTQIQPAQIHDPQMHLEGSNIHLDRGRNLSWITGAGILRLPVTRTMDGKELETPEWLSIWWNEKMTFDGNEALFFGDVRSIMKNHRILCQEMQVLLTNRFSFSEKNTDQKAEISKVNCKDNVDFLSAEYEENRLTSIRQGKFNDFSLNQVTGKTTGEGPGWISTWQRGRGKRAGLTPIATVKSNSKHAPDTAEWEYLRIDFSGTMNGNTKSRATEFYDQVEVVYGPVENSQQVISADDLPRDGGWMRSDRLRVTQVESRAVRPASEKASSYVHLQSDGNAKLEGKSFNARAASISFDESRDLYVLTSLAPHKATIWRQAKVGGKRAQIDAQRIEFWPTRNKAKFDGATQLDGVD